MRETPETRGVPRSHLHGRITEAHAARVVNTPRSFTLTPLVVRPALLIRKRERRLPALAREPSNNSVRGFGRFVSRRCRTVNNRRGVTSTFQFHFHHTSIDRH